MIEEFRQLYADYISATDVPEKRGFLDIFRGWFTGRGREMSEKDRNFMESVGEYVKKIAEEAPDQAFSAASVILSQPRSKKAEERDVLLAAMYSVIPELLPCMSTDELKRLRELAAEVPRMYRFPVYKQFMQKIDEMLG